MSACHSRISRATVLRFSSDGISSPSWMSRTSVSMPKIRAHSETSALRRFASGPPAISKCPTSPFVIATNFTLYPRDAHTAAIPPVFCSASSGWAPNAMIRSGRGGVAGCTINRTSNDAHMRIMVTGILCRFVRGYPPLLARIRRELRRDKLLLGKGVRMADLSRREFLRKTATDAAVAGFLVAGAAELAANPLGLPIGSQTWPHRQMIKDGNVAGLLKALADIGVQTIELCSPFGYADFASLSDGKAVARMIRDHGLTCVSAHFGMRELREKQQASIAWAKDAGITQMITASLGAGNTPTLDDVKKAADEYNRIADVAAKAGIQQGLHNEGFEVSTVDGQRTYDVLMTLLDPKLVKFQFQMSTISQGFVAADYFTKYPGRFFSMHVQDVDLNATPPPGGRGGGGVQVAVGKGSIDWSRTFAAAKVGGVKNYFVEQTMELTKESVAALKGMRV